MQINTSIFKAYDIRGLYPSEINEDVARQIGRGFVGLPRGVASSACRATCACRRPASPPPSSKASCEQGADVVDYGMAPTDMMYFAVAKDDLDGGAQVTASHNPKQYNGVKMVRRGAEPLSGEAGLGEIRDMIVNDRPAGAGRQARLAHQPQRPSRSTSRR